MQEAFVDYHLRNVSDRYDFDSIRIGIQPFQCDFRGFLFNDQQLGVRLFGNRDDNRFQYNLAAFWRLEKDTNSGLNASPQRPRDDLGLRRQRLSPGFPDPRLSPASSPLVYNRNREGDDIQIDDNGFPVRPALLGDLRGRDYDVVYLGYNADGHIGRLNLTASAYGALGRGPEQLLHQPPGRDPRVFRRGRAQLRSRLDALPPVGRSTPAATSNPYDNTETGFDAIFENPIFAGADTSYWIRQSIPFAGGGRAIAINGRNGMLNDPALVEGRGPVELQQSRHRCWSAPAPIST